MNWFLYIFSKVFGSKIALWIDNDGDINVFLFLILAVVPFIPIIYYSGLDGDAEKGAGMAFIAVSSFFYFFLKPYFNYLVVLNFIFWLLFYV